MHLSSSRLTLAPTDLGRFLACRRLTGLEGKRAIEWAQAVLEERWKGRFKGCLVLSSDEIVCARR